MLRISSVASNWSEAENPLKWTADCQDRSWSRFAGICCCQTVPPRVCWDRWNPDCLVLSLGRRFTIYCLESLLCSFVVLGISVFISGRAGDVESLDLRSSRALIFSNIFVGTGSVLSRCRPECMWCDAALRMMACKIFSPFWQLVGIRLLLSLSLISLLYRSQFAFFSWCWNNVVSAW